MDRNIVRKHREEIANFFDVDIHEVHDCHKENRYTFFDEVSEEYWVYDYINEVTFHFVGRFSFILDALRCYS